MVHELKEPEIRRAEILDVAEELFNTKGFDVTTTGDILQKAGIARGTLYYHFKSKDEILDAVIEREINRQIEALKPIIHDHRLDALEKIKQLFFHQQNNQENEKMLEYLHHPENLVMHHKSLIQGVRKLAPVIAEIIQQGINEEMFHNEHPLELTEFLLVGMNFLFDTSIFSWSPDQLGIRMQTLADILETSLRTEKGSFGFLILPAQETQG